MPNVIFAKHYSKFLSWNFFFFAVIHVRCSCPKSWTTPGPYCEMVLYFYSFVWGFLSSMLWLRPSVLLVVLRFLETDTLAKMLLSGMTAQHAFWSRSSVVEEPSVRKVKSGFCSAVSLMYLNIFVCLLTLSLRYEWTRITVSFNVDVWQSENCQRVSTSFCDYL